MLLPSRTRSTRQPSAGNSRIGVLNVSSNKSINSKDAALSRSSSIRSSADTRDLLPKIIKSDNSPSRLPIPGPQLRSKRSSESKAKPPESNSSMPPSPIEYINARSDRFDFVDLTKSETIENPETQCIKEPRCENFDRYPTARQQNSSIPHIQYTTPVNPAFASISRAPSLRGNLSERPRASNQSGAAINAVSNRPIKRTSIVQGARTTSAASMSSANSHHRNVSLNSNTSLVAPTSKNAASSKFQPTNGLLMPAASGSAQATHSLKPQRPAFSTLQQHFTPRKPSAHNRKTSGSLHSLVYSTANNPVSSENAHLQTELLHLHILHRSVAPVLQQWYNSAEEQIRRRFELISNKSSKLRIIEQRDQEQKNLRAVREWALNKRELGLAEKVQLLGLLIQEINTTSSTGGKFIRVLREFERWVANVEETWHVRSLKIPDKAELDIIASLDSTWRSEIAGLMRRAEQNLKDIAVLGPALEESGIATLLDRCKLAAESMVAELKRMEQVENIVMQRERVFLKELIQVVMSNKKPVEVKAAPHQSGVWNSAAIPQ